MARRPFRIWTYSVSAHSDSGSRAYVIDDGGPRYGKKAGLNSKGRQEAPEDSSQRSSANAKLCQSVKWTASRKGVGRLKLYIGRLPLSYPRFRRSRPTVARPCAFVLRLYAVSFRHAHGVLGHADGFLLITQRFFAHAQ